MNLFILSDTTDVALERDISVFMLSILVYPSPNSDVLIQLYWFIKVKIVSPSACYCETPRI